MHAVRRANDELLLRSLLEVQRAMLNFASPGLECVCTDTKGLRIHILHHKYYTGFKGNSVPIGCALVEACPELKPIRWIFSVAEVMAERVPEGGSGAGSLCRGKRCFLNRAAARGLGGE